MSRRWHQHSNGATVSRVARSTPPPPHRRSLGKSLLNPYKQTLLKGWNDGIRQPKRLMQLLQQQGYQGSERTLTRYISQLRQAQGLPIKRGRSAGSTTPVSDPQSPPLTPRRASFLMIKRAENREPEEHDLLNRLVAQHPDLASAVGLADEFLRLLRDQQSDGLAAWLSQALNSPLKPFQSFAESLSDDFAAVKASMMSTVSNGPVEGLNNRLKTLKRQMYGRAGIDLLERRFILAS